MTVATKVLAAILSSQKQRQTGVAVAISVKQERARNLTLGETSSILIYRVKVARKETRYESQQYEQGKI